MIAHTQPETYENRGNYCISNEQNEQGEQKKFLKPIHMFFIVLFRREKGIKRITYIRG